MKVHAAETRQDNVCGEKVPWPSAVGTFSISNVAKIGLICAYRKQNRKLEEPKSHSVTLSCVALI